MLVAFSVSPTTSDAPDGSVSEAVARAVRVVRDSGLPYETTSMFTTVEGEWDECMDVVKRARAWRSSSRPTSAPAGPAR